METRIEIKDYNWNPSDIIEEINDQEIHFEEAKDFILYVGTGEYGFSVSRTLKGKYDKQNVRVWSDDCEEYFLLSDYKDADGMAEAIAHALVDQLIDDYEARGEWGKGHYRIIMDNWMDIDDLIVDEIEGCVDED